MSHKILIVDDDADFRLGLSLRLRASGYEPVIAVDGLDATQKTVEQTPDLILLDLGLPAGDGFEVLKRIRSLPAVASTPVIVLSGRDPAQNEMKAINAGARAFYQKPVDTSMLMDGIESALR